MKISYFVFKIATSEYLKTIGSKLAPDIDIMWTGDKVIPKDITVPSLEEITTVLNRPPVIWDNEHANDYDQKRMYLGWLNNELFGLQLCTLPPRPLLRQVPGHHPQAEGGDDEP